MIFPFYHTVSDSSLPYISNLYPLRSIREFKSDLEYFCKYFEPVGIEEVHSLVKSKESSSKPIFHLTFDDGLREVYDVIAPILKNKGIPATFFVNTDFIDNKGLFYRYKVGLILERLKQKENESKADSIQIALKDHSRWDGALQSSLKALIYLDQDLIVLLADIVEIDFEDWLTNSKPYLSTDQIKDLLKQGFKIGSHSSDHPRFKHIDIDLQKEQIKSSFEYLEQNFELKNRFFSFPFGDEGVKKELFQWMYNEEGCKLSFGVSGIKDDHFPFHLHRIPMDFCQKSTDRFIKSEYLYFMLKSIFNKNRIHRA